MAVTTREFPYYAQLRKADPYFERDRVNQVEYEFPGRTFSANPATRGAYNDEPNGDLVMVDDGAGQGPAPTNIFSETTPDFGSVDRLFAREPDPPAQPGTVVSGLTESQQQNIYALDDVYAPDNIYAQ